MKNSIASIAVVAALLGIIYQQQRGIAQAQRLHDDEQVHAATVKAQSDAAGRARSDLDYKRREFSKANCAALATIIKGSDSKTAEKDCLEKDFYNEMMERQQ